VSINVFVDEVTSYTIDTFSGPQFKLPESSVARPVVPNRGAVDTLRGCRRNLNTLILPFLLLLKCVFNLLGSLHIIHFTAVMYLNQFRAVKCFLEKFAMMGNVIGVPQHMDTVQGAISEKKFKTAMVDD
jgi:hypothetical protein